MTKVNGEIKQTKKSQKVSMQNYKFQQESTKSNTDWFMEAKWGILIDYLATLPGAEDDANISVDNWNRRIDLFDTVGLANQLDAVGAKYAFITLGQNTGYYCAPNEAYDSIVGINPSKCSQRDLVNDLSCALESKGIKLLVYLTSGAPARDPIAAQKLEWKNDGGRLAEFQLKWESIIREWSLRWRKKVSGWWIDGCYYPDDMYRHDKSPNFTSFSAALKAGNPDSIIAFASGNCHPPVIPMTEYDDYTSGEINISLPVFFKRFPKPDRFVDGAQYHILTMLGDDWGEGQPRFSDEFVIGYTKYINEMKGVITWDIPIMENGLIPQEFINQLGVLSKNTNQ